MISPERIHGRAPLHPLESIACSALSYPEGGVFLRAAGLQDVIHGRNRRLCCTSWFQVVGCSWSTPSTSHTGCPYPLVTPQSRSLPARVSQKLIPMSMRSKPIAFSGCGLCCCSWPLTQMSHLHVRAAVTHLEQDRFLKATAHDGCLLTQWSCTGNLSVLVLCSQM